MIQLALVRHAAAEHGGDLDDHARRLSSSGLRDATEMAKRILRTGVRSEIVLSSSAVRARTTADAFATAFGSDVLEQRELYSASASAILAAARECAASEVMVVAHDPGMSELVSELAGDDVRMTTCAVAVFTWNDGDWDDVGVLPPDEYTLSAPS
jgi:phosphohistidine phosphatase